MSPENKEFNSPTEAQPTEKDLMNTFMIAIDSGITTVEDGKVVDGYTPEQVSVLTEYFKALLAQKGALLKQGKNPDDVFNEFIDTVLRNGISAEGRDAFVGQIQSALQKSVDLTQAEEDKYEDEEPEGPVSSGVGFVRGEMGEVLDFIDAKTGLVTKAKEFGAETSELMGDIVAFIEEARKAIVEALGEKLSKELKLTALVASAVLMAMVVRGYGIPKIEEIAEALNSPVQIETSIGADQEPKADSRLMAFVNANYRTPEQIDADNAEAVQMAAQQELANKNKAESFRLAMEIAESYRQLAIQQAENDCAMANRYGETSETSEEFAKREQEANKGFLAYLSEYLGGYNSIKEAIAQAYPAEKAAELLALVNNTEESLTPEQLVALRQQSTSDSDTKCASVGNLDSYCSEEPTPIDEFDAREE